MPLRHKSHIFNLTYTIQHCAVLMNQLRLYLTHMPQRTFAQYICAAFTQCQIAALIIGT